MARKPPALTLIHEPPGPGGRPPPPGLGRAGKGLWADIVAAYEFSDRGSYETLFQVCVMADRAERCREAIEQDGELIRTKAGTREHPLLRAEANARSFVTRNLGRLGLDLEPVRPSRGRPPSGPGLTHQDVQRLRG